MRVATTTALAAAGLLLVGAGLTWWWVAGEDAVIEDLAQRYDLSRAVAAKVAQVAHDVGADPMDLAKVIHFESAGEWSADVRHPVTGAVGLIQFTRTTARRLGTTVDELASLSVLDQLNIVREYLARVRDGAWPDDPRALPYTDLQSLAMGVFYPAYRDKPPGEPFPAVVTENNPGISTPADYLRKLENFAREAR